MPRQVANVTILTLCGDRVTALVLAFRDEEGSIDVQPHFWIPGDNIRERTRRDRVPYEAWIDQGLINVTDGNVIHYGAIQRKLEELRESYYIREIAFDRWGVTKLSVDLSDAGFNMIQFGQGYASMSAPTKELLNLVLSKKLRHGGNPVMRWMADSMDVKQDPVGNIKPVKPDRKKAGKRIDGMVALIMAVDRLVRNEHPRSVYNTRGIIVI
jgi:phage terminase large subunit-like protein